MQWGWDKMTWVRIWLGEEMRCHQRIITNHFEWIWLFRPPLLGEVCLINFPLLLSASTATTTQFAKLFSWVCFVVNSGDHSCLNSIMYVLTANSDTKPVLRDTNLSGVSVYLLHYWFQAPAKQRQVKYTQSRGLRKRLAPLVHIHKWSSFTS